MIAAAFAMVAAGWLVVRLRAANRRMARILTDELGGPQM